MRKGPRMTKILNYYHVATSATTLLSARSAHGARSRTCERFGGEPDEGKADREVASSREWKMSGREVAATAGREGRARRKEDPGRVLAPKFTGSKENTEKTGARRGHRCRLFFLFLQRSGNFQVKTIYSQPLPTV
jgi:hypothetical protein